MTSLSTSDVQLARLRELQSSIINRSDQRQITHGTCPLAEQVGRRGRTTGHARRASHGSGRLDSPGLTILSEQDLTIMATSDFQSVLGHMLTVATLSQALLHRAI